MPLYFAYGSNMDVDAMAARCPKARLLGRARLLRHRFELMADGFATLVRGPAATAQGALWELTFADIAALDRYEATAKGAYVKIFQPVLREGAGPARALVYIGRPGAVLGKAPPDYMAKIIAGARAIGLPDEYILTLRKLAGENPEPQTKFRAIKNPRLF